MIVRRVEWLAVLSALAVSCLVQAAPASAQPQFGPLDQGGMPCALLELRAGGRSAGWLLNANTSYTVWAAPKVVGQSFDRARWQSHGPYTLAGASHFTFIWETGGRVVDNPKGVAVGATISPGLSSLGVHNATLSPGWFIVNPLPPGLGARCPDRGESGHGSYLRIRFSTGEDYTYLMTWEGDSFVATYLSIKNPSTFAGGMSTKNGARVIAYSQSDRTKNYTARYTATEVTPNTFKGTYSDSSRNTATITITLF